MKIGITIPEFNKIKMMNEIAFCVPVAPLLMPSTPEEDPTIINAVTNAENRLPQMKTLGDLWDIESPVKSRTSNFFWYCSGGDFYTCNLSKIYGDKIKIMIRLGYFI